MTAIGSSTALKSAVDQRSQLPEKNRWHNRLQHRAALFGGRRLKTTSTPDGAVWSTFNRKARDR